MRRGAILSVFSFISDEFSSSPIVLYTRGILAACLFPAPSSSSGERGTPLQLHTHVVEIAVPQAVLVIDRSGAFATPVSDTNAFVVSAFWSAL